MIASKHRRKKLPIEQKESNKWLKSYEDACAIQARLPETMLVSVGDREAGIYELFERFSNEDNPAHLLVRSQHDRHLAEEQGSVPRPGIWVMTSS